MFVNFHVRVFISFRCCIAATICWFGINTAVGDTSSDVSCEDGDARTAVCQVQFTLYRQRCIDGVAIECSWGRIFDPESHEQICRTIYTTHCWTSSIRVTAWVQAETEEERKARIIHQADDFVVTGVTLLKYSCRLKDKEGNPLDWRFNRTECTELEEAYSGLVAAVGGSNLLSMKNDILNQNMTVGGNMFFSARPTLGDISYYSRRRVDIRIDVIEHDLNPYIFIKSKKIVETIAHERIHLGDHMFNNGNRQWTSADHNDPNGPKDDRVYRQGRWVARQLGASLVDWARGCYPPYQPRFWIAGWGHEMTDPAYCRLGEVIQH